LALVAQVGRPALAGFLSGGRPLRRCWTLARSRARRASPCSFL